MHCPVVLMRGVVVRRRMVMGRGVVMGRRAVMCRSVVMLILARRRSRGHERRGQLGLGLRCRRRRLGRLIGWGLLCTQR